MFDVWDGKVVITALLDAKVIRSGRFCVDSNNNNRTDITIPLLACLSSSSISVTFRPGNVLPAGASNLIQGWWTGMVADCPLRRSSLVRRTRWLGKRPTGAEMLSKHSSSQLWVAISVAIYMQVRKVWENLTQILSRNLSDFFNDPSIVHILNGMSWGHVSPPLFAHDVYRDLHWYGNCRYPWRTGLLWWQRGTPAKPWTSSRWWRKLALPWEWRWALIYWCMMIITVSAVPIVSLY